MSWLEHYRSRLVTAEEAVSHVHSGHRVALTLGDEPRLLTSALQARAGGIHDVTIQCAGPANEKGWFDPGISGSFRVQVQNSYRYTYREFLRNNQADYLPSLFTLTFKGIEERGVEAQRPDVFMTVVSPPDQNGFCSFGHSLWNKRAFVRCSRTVIVEVDPRQIRTYGTNCIHVSDIDYFVDSPSTEPITYYSFPQPDEAVIQISRYVSGLINDGDTIQVGWSRVAMLLPGLGAFDDKVDLGVHSEVTAPAIPKLVEAGVRHIVQEEKRVGGQLGRPSGARFRTYTRLKRYAEEVKGTLFDREALPKAIDDIYRYPLRQAAIDTLNRQLRSGIDDAALADLVIALREEDRLCVIDPDTEVQEPRIISSLGLFAEQEVT